MHSDEERERNTILKVSEIDDFSKFMDLKNSWNEILSSSMNGDIFSTWEWLSTWWKHFGNRRKLRILVARDDNHIIAIAPLMNSKYDFLHFGKLTKIEFVGSPQSDYNSFIFIKKELECVRLFLSHLTNKQNDWDYLELRDMCESTATMRSFRKILSEQSFRDVLKERLIFLCPYIELPNTSSEFAQRLGGDMRRNLRRRMRRLGEKYVVRVKTQNDFSSIEEAMNTFYKLHQKRWGSKGMPGVFADQTLREFHYDVARHFDERGWLRLYVLTVDDEAVASIYSFNYKQKKYEYLTGFDPEYSQYGVGNLIRLHVAEDCIREGLKEYDLMRGDEPYKSFWPTKVRKNFEVQLTRKGLFAEIYGWATKNTTVNALLRKFGRSLHVEH